mmetsp:Transcript_22088/g.28607  ORF Transcript_22088/g.28607 Transcript_22088/m.28607 type:complete len:580 (-) Transcript_22088:300-2039(-)
MIKGVCSRLYSRWVIVLAICLCAKCFEDQNEKCSYWALEGECISHAPYMLANCFKSCMFLGDTDENCAQQAEEGACFDPEIQGDMLIECAESCGYTYQWNPFVRQRMDIDILDPRTEPLFERTKTEVTSPSQHQIFKEAAVDLFRANLAHLTGNNSLPVLNPMGAPSEFHFVMGLGEALLYSIRCAKKVIHGLIAGVEDLPHRIAYEALEMLTMLDSDLSTLMGRGQADRLQQAFVQLVRRLEPVMKLVADSPAPTLKDEGEEPGARILQGDGNHLSVELSNGVKMPMLGFGTREMMGDECVSAVKAALAAGYRHIDMAEGNENEADVGQAIKESGVPRDELFLATKLSKETDLGYQETKDLIAKQLKDLNTDYIDLYMIQFDFGKDKRYQRPLVESWKLLAELNEQGVIRAIGLSNFEIPDIEEIVKRSNGAAPHVLQTKFSIYHQGSNFDHFDYQKYCEERNLKLVGYSSLAAFPFVMPPMEDVHVRYLAKKLGKSPAQVLLRWQLQLGVSAIPKSTDPKRIAENYSVFDFKLSDEDMDLLGSLSWLLATDLHPPTAENKLEVPGYYHPPRHVRDEL